MEQEPKLFLLQERAIYANVCHEFLQRFLQLKRAKTQAKAKSLLLESEWVKLITPQNIYLPKYAHQQLPMHRNSIAVLTEVARL